MSTRIYKVTNTDDNTVRLVDAGTPAAAIRHVTRDLYTATAATPKDVAEAMKAGVEVETAGAEPEAA